MQRNDKSGGKLSQAERHAQILGLLRREGAVQIAALAKAFSVTTETARRDLDELAGRGAVKRTYGGAANRSLIHEPAIGERERTRGAERARVAARAAGMVEPGDALMIDCGSTTSLFAEALAARGLHLTVVTNGLGVATALGRADSCRVVMCPGNYVAREGGLYGADTVAFIGRFKANKAFIGAGGLSAEGVTDADSLGCAVKRAMIERADRVLLLVDSAKFGAGQFERVCGIEVLDDVVCEAPPPRDLAIALRGNGVRVTIARG